jgi:hypothetical protein
MFAATLLPLLEDDDDDDDDDEVVMLVNFAWWMRDGVKLSADVAGYKEKFVPSIA